MYGDFFTIYLVKGHVEVKYDLGSGPVTLTSDQPVNMDSWNQLVVKRYRQVRCKWGKCQEIKKL